VNARMRMRLCWQVALRHQNFKHQRRKKAKKAAEGLLDDCATTFAPFTPATPARSPPSHSAHEGGEATLPTGGHGARSMQQDGMRSTPQMHSEPRRTT